MPRVSIIIPSRNEKFLVRTVEDVLMKARGDVEVVVCLDGYWEHSLPADSRIRVIHRGRAQGMRPGINAGVAVSTGEYLLKLDAHCMLAEGFDVELAQNCEPEWVVVPRRKRLDANAWAISYGKPDVDYEYLSWPDNPSDFGGPGLNGRPWDSRARERRHIEIDENLSFQGSGWFMPRKLFTRLELMDATSYGPFWNEAQEIGLKAWLSGGAVMTNKRTWYAHLHKGKAHGRGYTLDASWLKQGATFTKRWMLNAGWPKAQLPFEWLIERFWPVPDWPSDWRQQLRNLAA